MQIQLLAAMIAGSDATASGAKLIGENWPIIRELAWLFGRFMSWMMKVMDSMGIHSIGLSILLFTVITKLILLPLQIKQQKSTRMQSFLQPQLSAISKKYQGKKDQYSQQQMMEEQRALQEKYGVSMFGGCLPTLIQMPVLFGLYPVIYKMESYVPYLTEVLQTKLSAEEYSKMYMFLGIDLSLTPKESSGFPFTLAILIPLLVAGSQFLSTKMITAGQGSSNSDNPIAGSMKTMNIFMPLMMGFLSISFKGFLGLYWIIQSLVMAVISVSINKILAKKPMEEVIEENIKKANKKRAKKGQPPIGSNASVSTRSIDAQSRYTNSVAQTVVEGETKEQKEERIRKATEYYQNRSVAPGSLAAKANMVRDFNERNKNN